MTKRNVDVAIVTETENGDFEVLGGQRSAELEETRDTIEMTDMHSEGGYQEYDYGLGEWVISCDGVYIKDNKSFDKMKQAIREKEFLTVRITEDGKEIEEGQVVVTSRAIEGAYDSESTYSCELQGTGMLKKVTDSEGGTEGGNE